MHTQQLPPCIGQLQRRDSNGLAISAKPAIDPLPTEAQKCKSLIRKLLFFKRENEGIDSGKMWVLSPRGGSEVPGLDLKLQGWI